MIRQSLVLCSSAAFSVALLLAGRAGAEPSFSDRFVRGTSPGEVSTAKVVTIGSLYTLSAASFGLGVVNLLRAGSQRADADAYKVTQPAGFCVDLSSAACARYHDLHSEADTTRTIGLGLLGLGGLFALGGALTAELWQNDLPVTPTAAFDLEQRTALIGIATTF